MCPIRSQHSLDRLEMVRWESVPRGSSAPAWNISSRLFSQPNWLRLGLRGWWPLRSCLSNIDLTRRHGWTNYNQRSWKRVSLTVYYNGFGDRSVSLVTVILLSRRFCIDEGDCSESLTFKINSRFFKLFRVYSSSLKMLNEGQFDRISPELDSRKRGRKIGRPLFADCVLQKTWNYRHFQVAVVR